MAKNKLTPKQKRFVEEYLVDFNATRSAIRAGYKEKNAYSIGHSNLRKVEIQAAFQKAFEKQQQRTQITADRVLQEMARLATFDPRRLFREDGTPIPITELDDDTAACVGGMDIIEKMTGDKDNPEFECVKKMKIWDKNSALEKMAKHFKMLTDKTEHTGKDGEPIQHEHKMSPETRELLQGILGDDKD